MAKAKRKRANGVPDPIEIEFHWVKDNDGQILRWVEITDYDACGKAPHEPKTYVTRLSNGRPFGHRLHNMSPWEYWRKAIRELPFNVPCEIVSIASAEEAKHLSDDVIADWAKRHDVSRLPGELRCMVEDAASLDLLEKNGEVAHG